MPPASGPRRSALLPLDLKLRLRSPPFEAMTPAYIRRSSGLLLVLLFVVYQALIWSTAQHVTGSGGVH